MKITDHTPRRLRITHLGWYYGVISAVFGLLCLYAAVKLFGAGALKDARVLLFLGCSASLILGLIATRRFTVTLDRDIGVVHVRNGSVFGTRVRSAPLERVLAADRQASFTGDLAPQRLVLRFDDRDDWVVTRMYTSGDSTAQAAKAINTWLRNGAHFA